ncbi:glycosyltransferase [Xenorhabdus thailandensis]|uniref:glycosyltransferase n=1 Tax=Xenorhabdus thailandensis TaxID=3136255 RepID=UPI003BF478C9
MNKTGYLFTLDDDLIYPPDYIEKLIEKIEKYERNVFICVHGNIIDRIQFFHIIKI